jgi:hypothetical protein
MLNYPKMLYQLQSSFSGETESKGNVSQVQLSPLKKTAMQVIRNTVVFTGLKILTMKNAAQYLT